MDLIRQMETTIVTQPSPTAEGHSKTVVKAKRYDLDKYSLKLPQMRIESCGLTVDLSNRGRNWKERKRFKRAKQKSLQKTNRGKNKSFQSEERGRDVTNSHENNSHETNMENLKLSLPALDEDEGQMADYVSSMKIGQMPSPSFINMEEFYRDMMSALAPPNLLPKTFQSRVIGKPSNVSVSATSLSKSTPRFKFHNLQKTRELFTNTNTFQPRSSQEVSILSHLASKRRSQMEEARNMLSSEPFQGYSSREKLRKYIDNSVETNGRGARIK